MDNMVDEIMQALGFGTNKELSDFLGGVSEKTIIGWKKKLSPLGKKVLSQALEIHKLKEELADYDELKRILKKLTF